MGRADASLVLLALEHTTTPRAVARARWPKPGGPFGLNDTSEPRLRAPGGVSPTSRTLQAPGATRMALALIAASPPRSATHNHRAGPWREWCVSRAWGTCCARRSGRRGGNTTRPAMSRWAAPARSSGTAVERQRDILSGHMHVNDVEHRYEQGLARRYDGLVARDHAEAGLQEEHRAGLVPATGCPCWVGLEGNGRILLLFQRA